MVGRIVGSDRRAEEGEVLLGMFEEGMREIGLCKEVEVEVEDRWEVLGLKSMPRLLWWWSMD